MITLNSGAGKALFSVLMVSMGAFAFTGCDTSDMTNAANVIVKPDGTGGCKGTAGTCIAIHGYSYKTNGTPVVDQLNFANVVAGANKIWAQCDVAFELENYDAIDPASLGLPTGTAIQAATSQVRSALPSSNQFVVTLTDSWQNSYVGWTQMPGTTPYGAVEDGVWVTGSYNGQVTFTHELGHYMGLDHVSDPSNLMNPTAVATANNLTQAQCDLVHTTNQTYWTAMMR